MAVCRHLCQDLLTIVESGGHQVGSFVAGKAEHDPLVAGTFILVAGGIDALRDICGLGMQVVGEIEAVPVEPLLLITDALDRLARGLLDLLADTGRPIAVSVHDSRATNFAGEDNAVGRRHRLACDPRFGVLGQEQIDDRVRNLVGDLVGVTFRNGFGREQI